MFYYYIIDKQVYVKYNEIKVINMKQLYIDFDGVILDTIPLLYEAADKAGVERNDRNFYSHFDFKNILKEKYVLCDSLNCIQKLIDSNKFNVNILTHCNSIKEGADKVILLSHLGVENVTPIWNSTYVISHTTGIDAVIDGIKNDIGDINTNNSIK